MKYPVSGYKRAHAQSVCREGPGNKTMAKGYLNSSAKMGAGPSIIICISLRFGNVPAV